MPSHDITYIGTNPFNVQTKEDNMSDVQNAIEELVVEQVNDRIEDAISESSEIASMKDDISDLEQKVNELDLDDVVTQVMHQLTESLVQGLYGNNTYVMVKKSYIVNLKTEVDVLKQQQTTSDVLQSSGEEA